MNWGWNYLTFQRGTRLITGISGSRIEDVMPARTTAPTGAMEPGEQVARRPPAANVHDRAEPHHV